MNCDIGHLCTSVGPWNLMCFIEMTTGRGQILSVSQIIAFLFGNAFLEQNFTFGV